MRGAKPTDDAGLPAPAGGLGGQGTGAGRSLCGDVPADLRPYLFSGHVISI